MIGRRCYKIPLLLHGSELLHRLHLIRRNVLPRDRDLIVTHACRSIMSLARSAFFRGIRMDLNISATERRHRDEVREFIAAELTPDLREAGMNCSGIYCDYPAANRWHRILARRGWSVTTWPVQYGGADWTPDTRAARRAARNRERRLDGREVSPFMGEPTRSSAIFSRNFCCRLPRPLLPHCE